MISGFQMFVVLSPQSHSLGSGKASETPKGPRDCPGRRLALMEAKFILVSLLSNFRLKETEDIRKPLDLEFRGITIGIKGDRFRVGVEKRDD